MFMCPEALERAVDLRGLPLNRTAILLGHDASSVIYAKPWLSSLRRPVDRLKSRDQFFRNVNLSPTSAQPGTPHAAYWQLWQAGEAAMATDHATIFNAPTASDASLAEVVRRLVEAYHPERIYLVGSVARGDAGPDSDYDIMVVVPNDAPLELRRSPGAHTAPWGTGVASDVLVWTANQFDSRTHLAASLPATVLREGKLLHAA